MYVCFFLFLQLVSRNILVCAFWLLKQLFHILGNTLVNFLTKSTMGIDTTIQCESTAISQLA